MPKHAATARKTVAGLLATVPASAMFTAIASVLVITSAAYGGSTFAETKASVEQAIPHKRATHAEIARKNLNHSLDRARRLSAAKPNSPAAAKAVADLLLMRLQFYRNYDDLDELKALCDRWQNDARTAAQYMCADVDAARHDFEGAIARIKRASARSSSCNDARRRVAAIGATLQIESNQTSAKVGQKSAAPEAGYENAVVMAAMATAEGQRQKAVAYYRQAVSEYADVSPYPIAWAWHQSAELLRETNPSEATRYYEAALKYVPDYIAPRVELAALQLQQGDADAALKNLEIASALSADPDIDGLIAQALALSELTEDSAHQIEKSRQKAAKGFEALLKRHPFAFADHAAEVFAELDNTRAEELRVMLDGQKQKVRAALAELDC